mmetsp:Transcript_7569/g.27823  ORF Transcript_7569/g.27823 Transcript_7569/m.27823 type:complete len:430 (+) Transcript_7569:302-1591(+)
MPRKARHKKKLFAAAAAGSLSTIKKLRGKDVIKVHTSVDDRGRSALHLAARGGFADVVRYLLQKGADVNLQDKDGDTPMHHSTRYLRFDVNVILNEFGARTDIRNHEGSTALQLAANSMAAKQEQVARHRKRRAYEAAKAETDPDEPVGHGLPRGVFNDIADRSGRQGKSRLEDDPLTNAQRQQTWFQRLYDEAAYEDYEYELQEDAGFEHPYEDDGYGGEAWRDDLREQMELRRRKRQAGQEGEAGVTWEQRQAQARQRRLEEREHASEFMRELEDKARVERALLVRNAMLRKREKHEKEWRKFAQACEKLQRRGQKSSAAEPDDGDQGASAKGRSASLWTFERVPFPGGQSGSFDDIAATVLGGDTIDDTVARARIKEAVLRWHPDKFNQRYGFAIEPTEGDRVMERVATIAQCVNDLYKDRKACGW